MVTICDELGLDLTEVMQAKPWWIPEEWNQAFEEEIACEEIERWGRLVTGPAGWL